MALLDIDICGPSQPRILGVEKQSVHQSGVGWQPVPVTANLGVMSIGFLLDNKDDSIVWRGPRKNGAPFVCFELFSTCPSFVAMIKQFLKDVYWDELDYLIIDTPPGTSGAFITCCILYCCSAQMSTFLSLGT